jgi:GxxExxY protein
MLHDHLTEQIIGAFYGVHRELGHGFVESVYERSMVIALRKRDLFVQRQVPVVVHYLGEPVGTFCADLVVERAVIAELKACRAIEPVHEAQLLNYLRASFIEVGLLLHFATKASVRRLILTNDRKASFSIRGAEASVVDGTLEPGRPAG